MSIKNTTREQLASQKKATQEALAKMSTKELAGEFVLGMKPETTGEKCFVAGSGVGGGLVAAALGCSVTATVVIAASTAVVSMAGMSAKKKPEVVVELAARTAAGAKKTLGIGKKAEDDMDKMIGTTEKLEELAKEIKNDKPVIDVEEVISE
jgi:hypothetical protein